MVAIGILLHTCLRCVRLCNAYFYTFDAKLNLTNFEKLLGCRSCIDSFAKLRQRHEWSTM